jgi:hypothetical protein
MGAGDHNSSSEPRAELLKWLNTFQAACEDFARETERMKEILALGLIVKKKSTAASEEYWHRNQSKSPADRESFPRVTDIPEQSEIERINESHSAALNALAILRANLPAALPLEIENERISRLLKQLHTHSATLSNEELIRNVRILADSLPKGSEVTRKRGRPSIPAELKERALAMKDNGASNRECAKVLYQTSHPTVRQVKNLGPILSYFRRTRMGSEKSIS